MTVQKIQIETLKEIAAQCQAIVARHDDILFKVKGLSVALWSVTCGWALAADTAQLLFVALIGVLGLWFVAATFRGAQKRYIGCSDLLYRFLTDSEELSKFEKSGCLPANLPRSLGGHEGRVDRGVLLMRGLVSPTVSMFYGLFAFITIVLVWEMI